MIQLSRWWGQIKKKHLKHFSSIFERNLVSYKRKWNIILPHRIHTDPNKSKVVIQCPVYNFTIEVRSIPGLCSYNRRCSIGFAEIAWPLHRLTDSDRIFVLDCVEMTSPKHALCTDNSNIELDEVLSQKIGIEEKVLFQ